MLRTIVLTLLAMAGGLICGYTLVFAAPVAVPAAATSWLDTVIAWIGTYWWAVTIALVVLGSVLNSVTKHYGAKYPAIVPLFGVILEAISVLTSKDARNGSWGRLKLPLQNVPPGGSSAGPGGAGGVLGVLLVLVLPLAGGCATFGTHLTDTHRAVDAMTTAANKAFHKECRDRVVECKQRGVKTWRECTPYLECDQGRAQVNEAVVEIEDGMLLLDKAYKKARKEGWLQ